MTALSPCLVRWLLCPLVCLDECTVHLFDEMTALSPCLLRWLPCPLVCWDGSMPEVYMLKCTVISIVRLICLFNWSKNLLMLIYVVICQVNWGAQSHPSKSVMLSATCFFWKSKDPQRMLTHICTTLLCTACTWIFKFWESLALMLRQTKNK